MNGHHMAHHEGGLWPAREASASTKIRSGQMLSQRQEREVRAALALLGIDQKGLSAKEQCSYTRLNRVVARREVVTALYARILNALLARAAHAKPFTALAA